MSSSLILLTGASGHVGFRTLVTALEAGYRVRATVRSQAKVDAILATPSIKSLSPGPNLSFVLIPDILADDAYEEALKDVTYVVHVASPIPMGSGYSDFETDFIQPAIKGTIGILASAKRVPSVKRIVITSSSLAVSSWADITGPETNHVYHPDDRVPSPPRSYSNAMEAYAASKVLALNATDAFIKTEKPSFDVINVEPVFVIGKNELITEAKDILQGTNGVAFAQVLGHNLESPNLGTTVHVNDVAKVHILALNPEVQGNQDFAASSGGLKGTVWSDAIEIVKRRFPEAVKDGRLPANGTALTKKIIFDPSKSEKILGIEFLDYEEQVVSVTEHYLELLAKAA